MEQCVFCGDKIDKIIFCVQDDETTYPVCVVCREEALKKNIPVGAMITLILDNETYEEWADLSIKNSCMPEELLSKVVSFQIFMKQRNDAFVNENGGIPLDG